MNAVRTQFDRFAGWVTGAKHAGYSLSALRILYGIAIVSFLLTSLADRHYLWGVASRWVDPEAKRRAWFPLFEVVFTKDSTFLFDLAYGALIVLGVLFLIGWQTRFVTPVLLVFWVGLATNSTVLTNGGDTILRITLLFLVFANLSRHWSVDAWLARRRGREPRPILRGRLAIPEWLGNAANNTAVLLCGYQIMLVYVNSGIYKLMGAEWREGTAFYYSLVLDVFRPFPALSDLAWQIAPVVWVATFLSVWVQLLFPVLILWRPTRIVALGFTILMHLGIGLFLGLWPFSLAMIALDLLFVRDRTWVAAGRWATHAGGVLRQLLPDRAATEPRDAADRPVTTAAGSPS